jgi:ADP-heptose:LPS heptosyltransferase
MNSFYKDIIRFPTGMVHRILIVRLSALGDTALTLPLLSAVKAKLPEAFIGWLVGEYASPLLKGNPLLDRLHVWKRRDMNLSGLMRTAGEIRSEDYDVSLDPQGLTISALFPLLGRIPKRVGFSRGFMDARELAPCFTNFKIAPPEALTHITARTLYLGRALGLAMPADMPAHLPADPSAEGKIDRWMEAAEIPSRTIVFGLGTGWRTRFWPVPQIAELIKAAKRRGYACVVLWGPAEATHIGEWKALLKNSAVWAPRTDILEMIGLLRRCERYAGPDSAPLHLASLLGKPTFSWYGSTDPARTAPRGSLHARVARGPHNWRRRRIFSTRLERLPGKEVVPAFLEWLNIEHS